MLCCCCCWLLFYEWWSPLTGSQVQSESENERNPSESQQYLREIFQTLLKTFMVFCAMAYFTQSSHSVSQFVEIKTKQSIFTVHFLCDAEEQSRGVRVLVRWPTSLPFGIDVCARTLECESQTLRRMLCRGDKGAEWMGKNRKISRMPDWIALEVLFVKYIF